MNNQIKVALVDDECLFTEGLVLLFSDIKNISIIISSNNGSQFLDYLLNISPADFPEIVLVDIQMKPMDGFELVEILRKKHPDLKIIVLSSHYKDSMLGHMIKLGVSAFLAKNSNRDQLVEAIKSVHKTGFFFTQKEHQMLLSYVKNKSKKPNFSDEQLSEREIEVMKFICLEYTNQEIADKLFLSKRTVEGHRQRILEKISAKNTVGIVVYAIAHEIYIPPHHFYYV